MSPIQVSRLTKPGDYAVGGVDGLTLQIAPGGSRSWILRAMMGGKRREMGLGGFPDVPLKEAKEAARSARAKIKEGVDPIDAARQARGELAASRAKDVNFEDAAMKYIGIHEVGWTTKSHTQWVSSLKLHAFPKIGSLLVREIGDSQVLEVLEPIWKTKTETATRVRGRIEQILDWATVSKLRDGPNPARWKGHLEHMLPNPSEFAEEEHFAALPYSAMGDFMKKLRLRQGQRARCLEFLILTAVRSTPARGVARTEVDFEEAMWIVPAERMKGLKARRKEHRVPLSKAAIRLLKAQPVVEGTDLFFPSATGKLLSDMTLSGLLKDMGVPAVPHGFRSTFKDWATEMTKHEYYLSEMALAHNVGSDVERAYLRGDGLEKRRHLMEDWAQFCEKDWVARKPAKMLKAPR